MIPQLALTPAVKLGALAEQLERVLAAQSSWLLTRKPATSRHCSNASKPPSKCTGCTGREGLWERFFHGSTRLYCAAVSDIASINFSEARPMISILAVSPASSRIMLVALIRSSSATT
jgi:hypothetical protein